MTSGGWWSNGITQVAIELNSGAQARMFCGVDLFLRARYTNVQMTARIYDQNGPFGSGKMLGGPGTQSISQTMRVHSFSFQLPASVPPNTRFFLVLDSMTQVMWPVAASGTNVPHYRWLYNQWTRQNSLPWSYQLRCVPPGPVAKFSVYGSGCKGSPGGCQPKSELQLDTESRQPDLR